MARSRKSGKYQRKTVKRRSRKKTTNLSTIAQQLLIANMLSEGVMGVDLMTFAGLRQDFAGGYSAGNNSDELTAREIFNGLTGMGSDGIYHGSDGKSWQGGIGQVLASNARKNIGTILFATVAVPILFKTGSKLLAKPIRNPINKLLRQSNLGVKV